jgi:hypothetical protein
MDMPPHISEEAREDLRSEGEPMRETLLKYIRNNVKDV